MTPAPPASPRKPPPKAWTILKVLAAFPLAWFGGSLLLDHLLHGTWIAFVLPWAMRPHTYAIWAPLILWSVRAGVLWFLLARWVPSPDE